MSQVEVQIVPAEALIVGPDEVLVIHIKDPDWLTEEDGEAMLDSLNEILTASGLKSRSFVLVGEGIELTKVAR